MFPPRFSRGLVAGTFASLLIAGTAIAAQGTDFSGAWRLDDRSSDTPDALTAAMRVEARKELAAQQATPASSSSSAAPASNNHGGGRHGGMGGGGMGGHGGGMGGGGRGRHGGDSGDGKPANGSDKDPIATATYPMPPTLKTDTVLLVQQDDKTFQVRLNNGDQLTGKLDGVARQTLNGNAMVRGHMDNGQLTVNIRYADGTQLDQTWALTADGKQMVVTGAWKVPTLEQAVTFKRTYVGLH
ncbi:hypothetical protein SAMN04487785_104140 [Dyella jiangningensis]|uniref:hypothetical protein n=1 Tax=Dyella sp. AtDHG13 TaxID=1938897 RepID=UPI000889CCED|nr:hypothetical protein [Dyella sp. AtDHG13]PXV58670.1 hypothetical protein BDW41_105179 [Dyella sp. AtDHG13]SDJ87149.1 hypothetical protein SAMN04487785_104140 [Dyella jiangningensis]